MALDKRCEVTYEACRNEAEVIEIDALDIWMFLWVEEGVEGKTLKAVEQDDCESEYGVDSHGNIHQLAKGLGGESKVEEKECHLNHEMHPAVHDLLSEEALL